MKFIHIINSNIIVYKLLNSPNVNNLGLFFRVFQEKIVPRNNALVDRDGTTCPIYEVWNMIPNCILPYLYRYAVENG